jgi:IS30 family transposase
MRVSHETIYKSLFIQARGVLKKELISHLRSRRIMRTPYQSGNGLPKWTSARSQVKGDLLSGGKNTHIATLVERQSRFVMLVHVEGKDSENVVSALVRQVKRLPDGLMSSLTWDRGTELAHHKRFTVATDVNVYFCDPQSPWQRGSNRNTS